MDAKAIETRDWLLSEWSEKLSAILESMADQRPVLSRADAGGGESATDPAADAVRWAQSFAALDKPAIWIATSSGASLDLGRRTLAAAGVESAGDSECLSTFLEILSQSMSALGESIGKKWKCAAEATLGQEVPELATGLTWVQINPSFGEAQLDPIWFAASQPFLDRLIFGPARSEEIPAAESAPANASSVVDTVLPTSSRTFDVLLDVSLPVSISFGKTMLPIKDVLRLTSGSIVELDRAINEPVEVIVNNCVIARGEVVVIEGNYGVRIQEIASRHDRLRTGTGASQVQRVLPGT